MTAPQKKNQEIRWGGKVIGCGLTFEKVLPGAGKDDCSPGAQKTSRVTGEKARGASDKFKKRNFSQKNTNRGKQNEQNRKKEREKQTRDSAKPSLRK